MEEALTLLLDQTSYVYERVKDYFLIKKGNKAVAPDLRTVRGIVRDENGQPLPGVNVRIEGTYVGRSTDEKGEFIMSGLKEGVVLVFSFIGYKDVTVQVGQRDVLEIARSREYGDGRGCGDRYVQPSGREFYRVGNLL